MKKILEFSKTNPILLFDGVCNLCNGAVQFVIKYDSKNTLRFAALQSETGQQILEHFNLPKEDIFSVILVENEKVYVRSSAALRMYKNMGGIMSLMYFFIIVPRPIRDVVYNFIAKNRYKWFGEKESCMIPTPELKARFVSRFSKPD